MRKRVACGERGEEEVGRGRWRPLASPPRREEGVNGPSFNRVWSTSVFFFLRLLPHVTSWAEEEDGEDTTSVSGLPSSFRPHSLRFEVGDVTFHPENSSLLFFLCCLSSFLPFSLA